MFYKKNPDNFRQGPPGVTFKTLTHGHNTSLGEFHLKKGFEIPEHNHPNEQPGYLTFHIDGKSHDTTPDDRWCIPAGKAQRGYS